MRQPALIAALTAALLATLIWAVRAHAAEAMTVSSPEIAEGGMIARQQVDGRCGGANVSPALTWSGAPAATRSFAVTVFDPDAAGGGWWHWIVFAIPPARDGLPFGASNAPRSRMPLGAVEGTNDFGQAGYDGPCPPAGEAPHHYRFTVWALDVARPPFGPAVTGPAIAPWLKAHALASTTLTARYGR